jgi:hypothetical protein
MSQQCSGATDLKALSLQMSRAFARDALTSAAATDHRLPIQPSSVAQGTPTSGGFSRAAVAPEVLNDLSEVSRLGLVSALSMYRGGSMGAVASEVAGAGAAAPDALSEPSASSKSRHGPWGALQPPTPPSARSADVLAAEVDRILAGAGSSWSGAKFLEKFGSRMILTYLMLVCTFPPIARTHARNIPGLYPNVVWWCVDTCSRVPGNITEPAGARSLADDVLD